MEGYTEAYYCYDFNKPSTNLRPDFLYNHARHNEVNVNHAIIRASYTSSSVRVNMAIMTGNYAQYNLKSEPAVLQHIYESHVGFKIKKDIWFDAGIFASHIGFESAISKDCWTLTRSIVAENSPYYESGAKLSWTPGAKWSFSALYLNGWQHIQRPPGNNTPAFGSQIIFKPNQNVSINYSTFFGNDKPDSLKQFRHYHNLYGVMQLTKKLGLIAGFDFGMEQEKKGSSTYNQWYTPVVILRYYFNTKFGIAARGEYYEDKKGMLITTKTTNGFVTKGYSLNFDYLPAENVLFRIEGKLYDSKDRYFIEGKNLSTHNFCLTSSIAILF
jgi:Putative beta-barrel porin-2, OmpL-like. bbp2